MPGALLPGMRPMVLEEPDRPPVLKMINQYYLCARVAETLTCTVFSAFDQLTHAMVAAKVLHLNQRSFELAIRIDREVNFLRRLSHDNIIGLQEVFYRPDCQKAYIILEWADLGSLRSVLARVGKLKLDTIRSIFHQISTAISYLHQNKIVHHDIKPGNILLFLDGRAKLCDFGASASFNSTHEFPSTYAYRAPELDLTPESSDDLELDHYPDADVDTASDPGKEDVWSLGITLYECIYHHLPDQMGSGHVEIPDSPDGPVRDLIANMLVVDPTQRFPIDQVLTHNFFTDAAERFDLDIGPPEVLRPENLDATTKRQGADICNEEFSFQALMRPKPDVALAEFLE
jgi:serine/threonine-protein kinase 11